VVRGCADPLASSPPTRLRQPASRGAGRQGQVFGLVGWIRRSPERPTGRRFPGFVPVLLTAVVPTHRCGAAPDSHRIPSCDDPPG
jgi:hypothetical protein